MPEVTHAITCADFAQLRAKAIELVGDDERAIQRLLELIAETNRTTLASLRENAEAAFWEPVSSAAHRIAGSARMLDCHALLTLLTQLEAAARERNSELATALMPRVADALTLLDTSIEAALQFTVGAAR